MKLTKQYLRQIIKEELSTFSNDDKIKYLDVLDDCLEKMRYKPNNWLREDLKENGERSLEFLESNLNSLIIGSGPEKQSKIIPAQGYLHEIGIIIRSGPVYTQTSLDRFDQLLNNLVAFFGVKY